MLLCAERAVPLVPASNVELAGNVQHLLQFLWRRLVRQFGRRANPDRCGFLKTVHRTRVRQPVELNGVQRQPSRHRIGQRHLEIECGLVAGYPVLAEPLENSADVLVFVLDRSFRAAICHLKSKP